MISSIAGIERWRRWRVDGARWRLQEPPSPGEAQGQPLVNATSPVYYRTKAAYVLWMLRDLVGDDALGAALRASNAAAEKSGEASAQAFQTALKTLAPRRDFNGCSRIGSMRIMGCRT